MYRQTPTTQIDNSPTPYDGRERYRYHSCVVLKLAISENKNNI